MVENYPCSSLIVQTNNGTITKVDPCKYLFRPKEPGLTTIAIHIKQGRKYKKIGASLYRAKIYHEAFPCIGSHCGNDTIAKENLLAQGGIRAVMAGEYGCGNYRIVSYAVALFRKGVPICHFETTNAEYSPAMKETFQKLEPLDQLLFYNITYTVNKEYQYQTVPLYLTIKE